MPTIAPVSERIVLCDQGGDDWLRARTGCVTSSRVGDAISKPKRVKKPRKGEEDQEPQAPIELATRRNMRFEIACEQLSGRASEHYVSRWMKEGKEKEPLARAEYEAKFGVMVEQIGFIYHPTIGKAGASPDGLVGDLGLTEYKCPKIETHLQYLLDDVIPEEYLPQMMWQLACDETRMYNDFVSYSPDVPEPYQLFVKRMERTKELDMIIRCMESEVEQFLLEVEQLIETLKARRQL